MLRLNFAFIKLSWKKVSTKWFQKGHVTLKTGVMMLKIQLWSQE